MRNLETGEQLPDVIPGTLSSLVWTSGNDAILYGLANENWRTDNVRLHKLGTPVADDKLLYKEPDIGFGVGIGKTAADNYIVIATGDNETSEVYPVSYTHLDVYKRQCPFSTCVKRRRISALGSPIAMVRVMSVVPSAYCPPESTR